MISFERPISTLQFLIKKQFLFTEKTEEEPTTEAVTTTTKTRNLSSRIGQWNSKDTRTRLRQVAEKRLRANALKSKLAATSAPSKRTTLASTTVVQSRGEEGLIGEGSEPEHTQIRTQTSRSIVMRRSRIKQQQEGKQHYFRAFHTLNYN